MSSETLDPESYFASLQEQKTGALALGGPDAYFAQVSKQLEGHHHHCVAAADDDDDTDNDADSSSFYDSSSEEDGDDDLEARRWREMKEDANLGAVPTPLGAPIGAAAAANAIPMTELEAGFWRKMKKAGSAAIRSFQQTGKDDRKKKKKDKETIAAADRAEEGKKIETRSTILPFEAQTASPSLATKSASAPLARKASSTPLATKTLATKPVSSSTTLQVAEQELVNQLGKLMHLNVDTTLPELTSAILHAQDIPNIYYANLALAAALGHVRLALESRVANPLDVEKFVTASNNTSIKKSALDKDTFDHLRNVLAVFSGHLNSACAAPGGDGIKKAIEVGSAMGAELEAMLDKTYQLGKRTVLSESHPVVRLGALMTSLFGMSQARATHQTEINASTHNDMKRVWSLPLTQATLHNKIRQEYE